MFDIKQRRRPLAIGTMMSGVGGATAVAMMAALRQGGSQLFEDERIWVVLVAVIGAFIAGLLVSPGFGKTGKLGWVLAIFAAIGATAIGAFLGGLMLFQTLQEAFICVVMLGAILVMFPITGLLWLLLMGAVHYASLVFFPKIPADLNLVPGPHDL